MEQNFKEFLINNKYKFENYLFFEPENGRLVARVQIGGEEALMKFYKKTIDRIKRVKTEIAVDKAINKFNKNNEKTINKTDLMLSGENEQYVWVVRRFYVGHSLASPLGNNLSQLFNHDIIVKDYIEEYHLIIDEVFLNVKLFHQLSGCFDDEIIKLDKTPRFNEKISEIELEKAKSDFGLNLENQIMFLEKIKSSYLLDKYRVSCFGDLIPSNILICGDGKIRLSDFELLCFDNYMLDFTYFWLFLWRYPKWQNYWLDKTVKDNKDQESFRACLIRQIVSSISWFDNNHNHVWLRYLQAAGESFEAILQVESEE